MCIALGSLDQAISVCPMCKVFPHAKCPHQREVCRNRALHPRIDVSYLKNAEVDLFNGCGYCKFARTNPPAKITGVNNPGFPGCCRSPTPNEYRLIPAADWRSVSTIHRIPIPSDVKVLLDSVAIRSPGRSPILKSSVPSLDRKNSSSPPTKSSAIPVKTTPGKSSRNSSPQLTSASLSRNTSSPPAERKQTPTESADKLRNPAQPSPTRKQTDLDAVTPKKSQGGPSPPVKGSEKRRTPTTGSSSPPSKSSPVVRSLAATRESDVVSNHSGGSGDSLSDSTGTVTSDGGFTDYLSDESEAELQRQAEAKAALLAQNQAEELEFKAARQQLAHVDLRPPKSWNKSWTPTNITNTSGSPSRPAVSARSARVIGNN